MKRCPTCQKTYTDENLSYCIDDGTPLVPLAVDDEATAVSPRQSISGSSRDDLNPAPYQPPSGYVPPRTQQRRVWPWVLGLVSLFLLVVVGLTIAAFMFLPSMMRRPTGEKEGAVERAPANVNATQSGSPETNTATAPANANVDDGSNANTDAPTDKELVLAQLTELEHEWTVANINADKQALDRILADDYVAPDINGQLQSKREYIRDIERDTTIQKWEFEDLKVTLRGDRATLTGKVRFTVRNQDIVFEFTDKFVWRNGRWQATGSVITELK